MDEQTRERLREIVEAGEGKVVGDRGYVPLLPLDSGAVLGVEVTGGWVVETDGGELLGFRAAKLGEFFEFIETPRRDFEDKLARAAEGLVISSEAVVASFPAIELVRQVLELRFPYYARLALLWLLPSELRELRTLIAAVGEDRSLPKPIRTLAQRLTVPE